MISFSDVYTKTGVLPGAVEFLYELLLERPAPANISHRTNPKFVEHMVFVKGHPYWHWWILQLNSKTWVGALSVTDRNEVGITIKVEHQRRGYAREALKALHDNIEPLKAKRGVRPGHFVANVAPGNDASHDLFAAAGGIVIQHTYRL